MTGMKVIAHLHGGAFKRYYHASLPLIRLAISWVLRRANVVIVLSKQWKHFVLEDVSPNIDVQVVPNSVDFMFAQEIMEEAAPGSSRNEDSVLFVGQLYRAKGLFDILKAAPLVQQSRPDVRFIIAGKAVSQHIASEIERAYLENTASDAILFLGQVTGRAKLELFLRASVFVLPSKFENMPYALLEAMSTGLPVVTTPVGAIPELVEEGINGFFIQPGDYYALADRIVRLLEDAPLRATMAQANRELILSSYMPDIAMARIDKIYRSLLGSVIECRC
jgi:glycosyltransferase involved in cell wall biosynthesis